ncbi:MAG: GNAT family N-acetyltransferase [Candidatus Sulfotelmatobacter sp.]
MIADKGKYKIEPLGDHDRAAFSCGNASLDRYIREQASQDVKRGLASVFVITAKDDPKQILAYYTLSSRELRLDQLPEEIAKKAGKYGHVGVTLLGRMAVAEKYKGTGLGVLTLMNALHKSLLAATDVASLAVFVEAVDSDAANFYRKYGFIELPEDKLKLLLPMKTIAKSFSV